MTLINYRRAVGVFADANQVAAAMRDLRDDGFPMRYVSVINRQAEPIAPVNSKVQEGTTAGAVAGGTVGGMVGLILGLGTIAAVPGLGPVVLLGAAAMTLATTLTSGVMGATAGGVLGALIGYGLPESDATVYRDRVHQGDYLVILEGSEADIRQAEAILSRWNIQQFRVFDTPLDVPTYTNSPR